MNRLWVRLTLAFLAIALLTAAIVALLSARSTGAQFQRYVAHSMLAGDVAQNLITYYRVHGSWDGVEAVLAELGQGGGQGMMGRGGRRFGPSRLTLADADGRVVADLSGGAVGRSLPESVLAQGVPLLLDGRQIGTLLNLRPMGVTLDSQGQAFLTRVRQSLVWAGVLAGALALALGLFLSRWLTAPLRRLSQAAAAIAAGDLSQQVTVNGAAEIVELGQAFNRMASSLREAETLRRNLMADVAHELRTPLTVIQGNLQAMLDGVYPLDQAQIATLYDETRLLTRLVEDLRELALAEAGQLRLERKPVDLVALARAAINSFAPAAEASHITLELMLPPALDGVSLHVTGDPDRLAQVVRNLLSNALQHTPSGGRVSVRLEPAEKQVRLIVSDTGSGIAPEDLPHIFDRFYRGDKSRSRRGGGAGLGLAIARQLVLAHGGTITVHSQPGQGATFTVTLPQA